MTSLLRRMRLALLGTAAAALVFSTTTLAGSGVGDVFNLGQVNTVNGTSTLTGTSSSGPQLKVVNQDTTNHALLAQASGAGVAVYGQHSGTTGAGPAVEGTSASTDANAFALWGRLTASAAGSGSAAVRGSSNSTTSVGQGVWGSQAGSGIGVFGTAVNMGGIGVEGYHTGSTGMGAGVLGKSASSAGPGVLGLNMTGGPGLEAQVKDNTVPPLKVNSTAKVANLNADRLDGQNASDFLGVNATAADSSKLGGLPAETFYRSRAEPLGNSVTTPDASANVGRWTSVTIGADGLPLVSYWDSGNGHLKVLHCGTADCSPGNTVTTADASANVGEYTSVTIGADGLPLVSYFDQGNGQLKVLHCGNAACNSGDTATTVGDTSPNAGEYTSVTIGADGLPFVSYQDAQNSDLKVLHCSNADCSSGNFPTTPDASAGVGDYTSVTIGADGLPFVSYGDPGNGHLKVLHCGDAACGSGNTVTTADASTSVGEFTTATIGVDGLPLVSYWDQGNDHLKVLHCGNAACSSGNTATTADASANVGSFTSVTIGADGLPLVSYFDYGNGHLKVLHCGNAACSSGNTATTADASANVGSFTSVTIGADGLPLVSYYDFGNNHLKVLHCANTFCVPYFRRR